jgi:hypothetical protein
MKTGNPSYYFLRMKQKFLLLRGIEILLWSIAIGLMSFYVLKLLIFSFFVTAGLAFLFGLITVVVGSKKLRLFTLKENDLATYLNRHYEQLEESADLLLLDDVALTSLQRLQKFKIMQQLEVLYPTIRWPHHIGQAIGMLAVSVIISIGLTAFSYEREKKFKLSETSGKSSVEKKLPDFIKNSFITISPPEYTGLKKQTSTEFNLQIPEGSIVQWKIIFGGNVANPKLILSGRDSIKLSQAGNNEYQITQSFKETGFYQMAWTSSDSSKHYSDFYKIEVVKDHPPAISVENLNQFVELSLTDHLKIQLKSILMDDYGLRNAQIIATVSKGSGESIKFREEKLTFDSPKKISGKKLQANRSIDLQKLGLQPGDELYFYIVAFDIKNHEPNLTRTETYFICLQDSSSLITSVDAGSGVDLLPDYFRSQRQIIIDSEKLLKEKKQITQQSFNKRSNGLGYDQKVLRLRYGEFLGEEFESGIGPQQAIPNDEDHEDITKRLGHVHDKDNEHNLVEEKKGATKNDSHRHADPASKDQKQDPVKEYVHEHDNNEEATFFVQSIKTKLKAALTIMWDAELYLRLYQPEKSLPYQYKALKLLKEISQDSRIYVHRTGFDPPPLKEEKRLTGDLSEIKNSTSNALLRKAESYPQIRRSLSLLEKILQEDSIVLSLESRDILTKAGQEMAAVALQQPTRYLRILSLLSAVIQDEVRPEERKDVLITIRTVLWNILPPETISPQPRSVSKHDLDLRFLKSLEASKINN